MIDRIREAEGGLGAPTEMLRERALDMMAVAREKSAQGVEAVRQFTINKPAQALGAALGMGVLLGWLIKRR